MAEYFVPNIKTESINCRRNEIVPVIYRRLASEIRNRAVPGMALMPVRNMASLLGIAPQTMQKVFNLLEADGVIARFQKRRIYQVCGQSEQSRCIGLLLPMSFISYFQLGTDFGEQHFRLFCGIADRAAELGYSILTVQLPPPEASESEIAEAIVRIRQKCCGIIHFGERGFFADPPLRALMACRELAQVSFNCILQSENIGAVTFDPEEVISTFISYAREFGHERFGFMQERPESIAPEVQYLLVKRDEIEEFFERNGVKRENISVFRISDMKNDEEWKIFFSKADCPTVFLCRNDKIAVELVEQMKKCGHRVPEDFSVVGFNNQMIAERSEPPLSTFDNPFSKIGGEMVNRLNLFLKNGVNDNNRLCRVKPLLIGRQSVSAVSLSLTYN